MDSLPVSELSGMAAPYNPRRISDHDLEALRRSIRFFGAVEPVVVNRRTNRIVGGHQRVKAAAAEELETFPVIWVDLDEPSEKQLNLALNRISGTWDDEMLREVLQALDAAGADLTVTGFEDAELARLLQQVTDGATDPDAVPSEVPERCAKGDLWQLGAHRLLCGDATSSDDVARLVDGSLVNYVFTSPPYGIDLEYEKGDTLAELEVTLHDAFAFADQVLCPGGYATINYADVYRPGAPGFTMMSPVYERVMPKTWHLRGNRIWMKPFGRLSLSYGTSTTMNLREWEYIRTWRKGRGKEKLREHGMTLRGVWKTFGDDSIVPDWTTYDETTDKKVHPAAFPVVLPVAGLRAYTDRNALVLDPFAGSGTCLIACEQLSRTCYALEIEPRYCDIVLARWEAFTGQSAELLDA